MVGVTGLSKNGLEWKLTKAFDYDVALSFAGEQRPYVNEVAEVLQSRGIRVFYDDYETVRLWGRNLYEHLHEIYANTAEYCVIFSSKAYARKVWPLHELKAAQERAIKAKREYILPVQMDSTQIPGLPSTVSYLSGSLAPEIIADSIIKKIGPRQRTFFLPPICDKLYEELGIESADDAEQVDYVAEGYFHGLKRMTVEERKIVSVTLLMSCPNVLPDGVHVSIGLLGRAVGQTPARIQRVLQELRPLGFTFRIAERIREADGSYISHRGDPQLILKYNLPNVPSELRPEFFGKSTAIVQKMVQAKLKTYCEDCAIIHVDSTDFSNLSSATAVPHSHPLEKKKQKTAEKKSTPRRHKVRRKR